MFQHLVGVLHSRAKVEYMRTNTGTDEKYTVDLRQHEK